MTRILLLLLASLTVACGEWKLALPGWEYQFPRDHGNHPGFKTEWWYFTGNVSAADGREFGYQLTFFRQGVSSEESKTDSRFVIRDLKLAHFALSDLKSPRFSFSQKLARGAYGEAGFDKGDIVAWIDGWSCERSGDGFRIQAARDDVSIDLTLQPLKPPVIHGKDGVSQKAEGAGRASHYYSFTRLKTAGQITSGGKTYPVAGLSWFDHEWATNQLGADQEGWDWFSVQFDDDTELMLFQLRLKKGGRDPYSGGTWIASDGRGESISNADFSLTPVRWWQAPNSEARYPVEWKLEIPARNFVATVRAATENQELNLDPIRYWEGAIRVSGQRDGKPISGRGYLEMTGYASKVVGMQAEE